MTATVTKVVGYGLTGKPAGVNISKLVGFVLLVPGSEAGAAALVQYSHTYGQRLRPAS